MGSGHKTDLGDGHNFGLTGTVDLGSGAGHIDAAENNPAEKVGIGHYDIDRTTVAVQVGNPVGSRLIDSPVDARSVDSPVGDRFDDSHAGARFADNPAGGHLGDIHWSAHLAYIPAGIRLDVHSACIPVGDHQADIREDAHLACIPLDTLEADYIGCHSVAVREDCNPDRSYCFLHVARVEVPGSHQLACQT